MSAPRGARALDHLRGRCLRVLLGIGPLRRIYLNRGKRLGFQHAGFASLALVVALCFPLWQLLLGPAILGYPHLVATLRYVPAAIAKGNSCGRRVPRRRALRWMLAACGIHVLYRFLADAGLFGAIQVDQTEWQALSGLDALFVLGVFLAFACLHRTGIARSAWGALCLAPLLPALLAAPLVTAGALVLLHNLIGYVYWISLAQCPDERRQALGAGALVLTVSGLVLAGALDPWLHLVAKSTALPFANLSVADLGRSILPAHVDGTLWMRATVAFAFGQSCHYFVWLKAIPETRAKKRVPATVRRSWRRLEEEFGAEWALVLLYAIGASMLVWLFVAAPALRRFYFLFAGFHGLVELAGLPHLLPLRSTLTRRASPGLR